jgi:hypothetical protein
MQTFGIQKQSIPDSDEADQPETIQEEQDEQEEPDESVAQSTGKKWLSLKDARSARRT